MAAYRSRFGAARAHVRASAKNGSPKGFAAGIESMVLYIRQVYVPAALLAAIGELDGW